eukprot:CAMPEP_0119553358 /NCGR_PEP_ID=MMETSP1352-20130426/6127_1 /TAXON_ID=265584 /ORGANISM="Stauroneis constricta, Strain CCMP1120" /LENGTH=1345 /DNA_ID=CAMNT_0007599753 /DNA_START=285 /DNA_END=4322 /DNA_ORIENTATION=+
MTKFQEHFVGRSQELDQLHQAYIDVVKRNDSSDPVATSTPAVLLWGRSGTGKSCLVRQFIDELSSSSSASLSSDPSFSAANDNGNDNHDLVVISENPQDGTDDHKAIAMISAARSESEAAAAPANATSSPPPFYFIQGKHDEHTGASDPFSAIVQALKDLATQIRSQPKDEIQRLRASVHAALGADAKSITAMVPALSVLVHDSNSDETRSVRSISSGSTDPYAATTISDGGAATSSMAFSIDDDITGNAWNRLQYTFLQFIKAVATSQRPLILFLDDMQWGSQVTADLLSTLLLDPALKHVFFVGAIRQEVNPHSDNPDDALPLSHHAAISQMLAAFQNAGRDVMMNIHLSNLEPSEMIHWMSRMLHLPATTSSSDTTKWTAFCDRIYSKTRGNIFFTIQALEQLQRAKILFVDPSSGEWDYDWPDRDHHSSSSKSLGGNNSAPAFFELSNTVVEAVANKLRLLRPQTRTALTLASYIRSNFDLDVLQVIVDNEALQTNFAHGNDLVFEKKIAGTAATAPTVDTTTSRTLGKKAASLESLLEEAVLEGLLQNKIGESTYRFAHDRIQQAAQSLIPLSIDGGGTPGHGQNNRDKLRYRIGACLWKYCQEKEAKRGGDSGGAVVGLEDHGLMFVAVDHLNSIPLQDYLFVTTVNLAVGKKALALAALESASTYLGLANDALTEHCRGSSSSPGNAAGTPWEEHTDLTLQLYQARTSAELALGNYDLGYRLGEEVLQHAKSINSKVYVYTAMASAMGAQARDADSLRLSTKGAQMLGVYPKRWHIYHAMSDVAMLDRYFQKHSDEEILRLPMNNDPLMQSGMSFLSQMIIRSFKTKSIISMVLSVVRALRFSFKKIGLCENTAFAAGTFGLLSVIRGDYQSAQRYSKLSRKIMERCDSKSMHGWIYFVTAFCVNMWSAPMEEVSNDLKKSYLYALESGDFESGILSWHASITASFFGGQAMGPLIAAGNEMLASMKLYNVTAMGEFISRFVETMKQIAGHGNATLDWEEARQFTKQSTSVVGNERYDLVGGAWARMTTATYFLQYEVLEGLCRFYDDVGGDEAYIMTTTTLLSNGIMAAGRFRQTAKKKYLKILKKSKNALRKFAIQYGNNCLHRSLILQAENVAISAMKGKKTHHSVLKAYDTAIAVAMKSGHRREAALCYELAAEYLLARDKAMAKMNATKTPFNTSVGVITRDYFTRALQLYYDWGGIAKAEDLERRRSKYINVDKVVKHTGGTGNNAPVVSMPSGQHGDGDEAFISANDPSTFQRASRSVSTPSHFSATGSSGRGSKTRATAENRTRRSYNRQGSQYGAGYGSSAHGALSSNGLNNTDDDGDDDISVLSNGSE